MSITVREAGPPMDHSQEYGREENVIRDKSGKSSLNNKFEINHQLNDSYPIQHKLDVSIVLIDLNKLNIYIQ